MRFFALFNLVWLCLLGNAYAVDDQLQPAPPLHHPTASAKPEIRDLGKGKYQIGHIVLDKNKKTFSLPGKILRLDSPIEFLAVSKDGARGYESFLELETSPIEFNLACILIGMEEKKGAPPKFHFDPTPIEGSSAELTISWADKGNKKEVAVTDLLELEGKDKNSNEWAYTGSRFSPDGIYMADMAGGTLIGLIHDPDSIIEHKSGYDKSSYSNLKADRKLAPPLNTAIVLTVQAKD